MPGPVTYMPTTTFDTAFVTPLIVTVPKVTALVPVVVTELFDWTAVSRKLAAVVLTGEPLTPMVNCVPLELIERIVALAGIPGPLTG